MYMKTKDEIKMGMNLYFIPAPAQLYMNCVEFA